MKPNRKIVALPSRRQAVKADLVSELARLRRRKAILDEILRTQQEIAALETRLLLGGDSLNVVARAAAEAVSAHFKLPIPAITGRSREERIAWPRQIVFWIVRQITGAAYEWIGSVFDRDHGTILCGCKRVSDRCDTEPETRKTVEALLSECERRLSERQKP